MSALFRNVSKSQRSYKERAQPQERSKWGILEKHKDYSLRAKDYNEKKKRLKILRQKAAERNPDEFHFAMMSSKTDGHGRKTGDRGNHALSHDVVKLLKTQDAGYLRNAAQRAGKLRERQEQNLALSSHAVGSSTHHETDSGRQHIAFVDSVDHQHIEEVRHTMEIDPTEGSTSDRNSTNRGTHICIEGSMRRVGYISRDVESEARAERKKRKRLLEAQENRLVALKRREEHLRTAESELQAQRGKIAGVYGGISRAGVKWKERERKK